jgi:uncharacterized protein (TIGR01777 family)
MYNKIILAGGTGYLGQVLIEYYINKAKEIVVLSRESHQNIDSIKYCRWDAVTKGEWVKDMEGADLLVNLCGKNVNCRYTAKNRKAILDSRIIPTELLIEVVQGLAQPPKLWLQCASATIYRHAEDCPQDEETGEIGTGFSVEVCKAWENRFLAANLPGVRKAVLRVSMVLGQKDGVFPRLKNLVLTGLGGYQGNGNQYVSWIHETDFARITEWLLKHEDLNGVFNVTAPEAISNRAFMQTLRKAYKKPFGLFTPKWLLEIGAVIIRTETELVLKSRWVYPKRLLDSGFQFQYPTAEVALNSFARSSA